MFKWRPGCHCFHLRGSDGACEVADWLNSGLVPVLLNRLVKVWRTDHLFVTLVCHTCFSSVCCCHSSNPPSEIIQWLFHTNETMQETVQRKQKVAPTPQKHMKKWLQFLRSSVNQPMFVDLGPTLAARDKRHPARTDSCCYGWLPVTCLNWQQITSCD